MNRKKTILLVIDVILMGLFVFLDQLSKYYAALRLKGNKPLVIVDGVFELHYLENNGAAFGMLQGQKAFFIFIAAVVLAIILYVILRTPYQRIFIKLNIKANIEIITPTEDIIIIYLYARKLAISQNTTTNPKSSEKIAILLSFIIF